MVSISYLVWELKKLGTSPNIGKVEVVQFDVYNPTLIYSSGGLFYYVTFIYNSTRKVLIYFMKNKYEFFNTFKKYKVVVKIDTNYKIKYLRSHNEEE